MNIFEFDMQMNPVIQRRRVLEHERKLRIFNERQRIFGIDKNALEGQLEEKIHQNMLEKYRNEISEQSILHVDKMAELLQMQEDERNRVLKRQLNEFRMHYQTPESRREFDINNPNRFKIEKPLRSDSNDDFPVSGCQKFTGEDPQAKSRNKWQKLQLKDCLDDQAAETFDKMQKQLETKHDHDTKLIALDYQALQLQNMEQAFKKKTAYNISDMNLAMAEDQKSQQRESRLREEAKNQLDMYTSYHSDLLSENPAVSRSTYGPHRVVPDRWKGMTRDQISAFRRGQIQQMEEKEQAKEQEKQMNKEWENVCSFESRLHQLQQKEMDKKKNLQWKQLQKENMLLSMQQKRLQDELENEYKSNTPTDSFFSQFNTSSR